ncbi:Lipoprotein OS=Streptomyces antimycoticus OX=68175 GN=SANT12839_075870 PE=4 SV=1 [Streptomyces antimycoticus]
MPTSGPAPRLLRSAWTKALPSAGASRTHVLTEYDTSATARSWSGPARWRRPATLAAAAEKQIQNCAADWVRDYPAGTASGPDYGALTAERRRRMSTASTPRSPDSEPGIHLCRGWRRDGRTVTVVPRGEMGGFDQAPVADFKRTTTTAVVKLYHP